MYVDDGHSYEHQTGSYLISTFTYVAGVLRCVSAYADGGVIPESVVDQLTSRVERLVIVGLSSTPQSVVVSETGARLEYQSQQVLGGVVVTVKDPKVLVGSNWEINII